MAKIKAQIKVDGVDLDNASWRKLLNDIHVVTTIDGNKTVTAEFIIEATTAAELLTRWNDTKDEFNIENTRVQVWIDDTAVEPLEDISPSDGTHGGTVLTQVTQNPVHKQAGHTIMATFMMATTQISPGSGTSRFVQFVGQVERIQIATQHSAGRVEARTVSGNFTTTFDEDAFGPFSITSVADDSGNSTLTVVGALPAFKDGQKCIISSTTNYNGTWVVTAIAGQTIDVTVPFVATDTGSCLLGQPTTGQENYDSAFDTILSDYLDVAADGVRDAVTGLALTGQLVNKADPDGNDVSFSLDAEWMELDITGDQPEIRKLDFTISTTQPERWPEGETPPTVVTVDGSYHIDRDALGTDTIHTTFETIKDTLITEVKTQIGQTDLRQIGEVVTSGPSSMIVRFGLQFHASATQLISLNQATNINRKFKFTEWQDADGFSIVQTPPEPWEVIVTKTVNRVGYDEVDLATLVEAPVSAGFTFLLIADNEVNEDPYTTQNDDTVFDQTYSAAWKRQKRRAGGITSSRPVIT